MVSLSERVLRADEFPERTISLCEVVGVAAPEGLGNDGFLAFFLRETFPGATLAERSLWERGGCDVQRPCQLSWAFVGGRHRM